MPGDILPSPSSLNEELPCDIQCAHLGEGQEGSKPRWSQGRGSHVWLSGYINSDLINHKGATNSLAKLPTIPTLGKEQMRATQHLLGAAHSPPTPPGRCWPLRRPPVAGGAAEKGVSEIVFRAPHHAVGPYTIFIAPEPWPQTNQAPAALFTLRHLEPDPGPGLKWPSCFCG